MARVHHVRYKHGSRAFKAAFDAAFPGLPQDMPMEQAERRITAALIAYDGVRWDEAAKYEQAKRLAEMAQALTRFSAQLAGGYRAFGAAVQDAGDAFLAFAATSKEAR
jgi:hypothetical protein